MEAQNKDFSAVSHTDLKEGLVSSVVQANHRININFASIDKVLSELELRFSGNDQ